MISIKTKKEFNEFVEHNSVCCVKFGAKWCGPCKTLNKTIEDLESSGIDYVFGDCDIDNEEIFDIGSEYGIKNLPFICIFNGGKLADISVGAISGDNLNNKVKSLTK